MDIEKLIETLRQRGIAYARAYGRYCSICDEAVTALSTLQAENKRLNKIVCSIPTTPDSGRTVSQYDKEMSMCAYLDDLEAENEKLRAEMKQERAHRLHAEQHADAFLEDCKRLNAELENYRKGHCSEGGCAAEKDRDAVLAELEQVKRERDAAVQCIRGIAKSGRVWMCPYCVHAKDTTGGIAECELDVGVCMMPYSKFEWRGPQKED